MTRGQIAEQIQRIIAGGDVTAETKVDIVELMYAIDQERDRLVGEFYKARINRGERQIDGSVLQRYTLKLDSELHGSVNHWFVDLPEKVIALPYDMGVYQVQENNYRGNTYARIPNGYNQLYSLSKAKDTSVKKSYAGNGEGHIFWYLESAANTYRLYFTAEPVQNVPMASPTVTAQGSGYAVNDEFHLYGSGNGGYIRITAVDGSGAITAFLFVKGSGYTSAPSLTYSNLGGGSGTGATFSWNIVQSTMEVTLLTSISMSKDWTNSGMSQATLESHANNENYPLPAELVAPLIRNVAQLYGVMYDKPADTTQDNQKKV